MRGGERGSLQRGERKNKLKTEKEICNLKGRRNGRRKGRERRTK